MVVTRSREEIKKIPSVAVQEATTLTEDPEGM